MLTSIPFARPQDAGPSVAIVTKVNRIQDQLVKKHDVELHMHLNRLEIAPQIYGMSVFKLFPHPHIESTLGSTQMLLVVVLFCLLFVAGGFVCCLAASFLFRTSWWCGTLCLLTASLWTLWTTSSLPCCSTSEMLVRTLQLLNNPVKTRHVIRHTTGRERLTLFHLVIWGHISSSRKQSILLVIPLFFFFFSKWCNFIWQAYCLYRRGLQETEVRTEHSTNVAHSSHLLEKTSHLDSNISVCSLKEYSMVD